jgi:putative hydrolase of the HAD superfamily
MAVRALLFDLGDTLFRLHALPLDLPGRLAGLLVRQRGIDPEQAEAASVTAVRSLRAESIAAFVAGETREWPLDEPIARHLDRAGLAIDAATARALADVFGEADVARFESPGDLAGRVETLARAGLRLAVVSNTTTRPELIEAYLDAVGIRNYFETAVFSVAFGLRKPHPDVYREALIRLDVAASEALFIGDRVREDVLGPQAVGVRAVLTHEFRQEDPVHSHPVAVITELAALQHVLRDL